ncbi:Hydrocephalus-inducing-like protein, partial [Aduncisulcus paluster]
YSTLSVPIVAFSFKSPLIIEGCVYDAAGVFSDESMRVQIRGGVHRDMKGIYEIGFPDVRPHNSHTTILSIHNPHNVTVKVKFIQSELVRSVSIAPASLHIPPHRKHALKLTWNPQVNELLDGVELEALICPINVSSSSSQGGWTSSQRKVRWVPNPISGVMEKKVENIPEPEFSLFTERELSSIGGLSLKEGYTRETVNEEALKWKQVIKDDMSLTRCAKDFVSHLVTEGILDLETEGEDSVEQVRAQKEFEAMEIVREFCERETMSLYSTKIFLTLFGVCCEDKWEVEGLKKEAEEGDEEEEEEVEQGELGNKDAKEVGSTLFNTVSFSDTLMYARKRFSFSVVNRCPRSILLSPRVLWYAEESGMSSVAPCPFTASASCSTLKPVWNCLDEFADSVGALRNSPGADDKGKKGGKKKEKGKPKGGDKGKPKGKATDKGKGKGKGKSTGKGKAVEEEEEEIPESPFLPLFSAFSEFYEKQCEITEHLDLERERKAQVIPSTSSDGEKCDVCVEFCPQESGVVQSFLSLTPSSSSDDEMVLLKGCGVRPVLHFEIPPSTYLEHRDPSLSTPSEVEEHLKQGRVRVVEMFVRGEGRRSKTGIGIFNPTDHSHHFSFVPVKDKSATPSPAVRLGPIVSDRGVIEKYTKSKLLFEYVSSADSIVQGIEERFFQFIIPRFHISTYFLVVGHARDPLVYLSHSQLKLKELVGHSVTETVSISNEEDVQLNFSIDVKGIGGGIENLYIDPLRGSIPAKGKTNLTISFEPKSVKQFNYALKVHVESRVSSLCLNVKGEGQGLLVKKKK